MCGDVNEDNDICKLPILDKRILINNGWGYPTVEDAKATQMEVNKDGAKPIELGISKNAICKDTSKDFSSGYSVTLDLEFAHKHLVSKTTKCQCKQHQDTSDSTPKIAS